MTLAACLSTSFIKILFKTGHYPYFRLIRHSCLIPTPVPSNPQILQQRHHAGHHWLRRFRHVSFVTSGAATGTVFPTGSTGGKTTGNGSCHMRTTCTHA